MVTASLDVALTLETSEIGEGPYVNVQEVELISPFATEGGPSL